MQQIRIKNACRISALCRRLSSTSASTRQLIDKVLRVDHAGELGADRIYAGQMCVLGRGSVGPVIQHMWEQEKEHLQTFERLISKHQVRPTVLLPVWTVAGYLLGVGSALLGKEGAMACTVAVEEVIAEHYNNQLRELLEHNTEENSELIATIKKFRDDEMEHHQTGVDHDAHKAPAFDLLKNVVQFGCRSAIWLSERI